MPPLILFLAGVLVGGMIGFAFGYTALKPSHDPRKNLSERQEG